MIIRFSVGLFFMVLLMVSCGRVDASKKEVVRADTVAKIEEVPVSTKKQVVMDTTISDELLLGKFIPEKDVNFVKIDKKYADKVGRYMHKEAYAAFVEMYKAALQDGIRFTIKSATRNFDYQRQIWEGKWDGKRLLEGVENAAKVYPNPKDRALKILEYSSMPSTSRHHWGTDIDLNAFVNSYFEKGRGLKEYEWLLANAGKYGFGQPYTAKGKERPHGYNEEKWHWSYLPLAKRLTEQYELRFVDQDIKGFKGAETAKEIGIIEKYVLGISHTCLH